MRMPDIKEKTLIKMNNLFIDYCKRYNILYDINNQNLSLSLKSKSSSEYVIANSLLTVIESFKHNKTITEDALDFFNRISEELEKELSN